MIYLDFHAFRDDDTWNKYTGETLVIVADITQEEGNDQIFENKVHYKERLK